MRADQIQARAVAKVVLVALFWAGLALLFAVALFHTRTTLQRVAAAIFLALALDPAVGLIQRAWPGQGLMPKVLAILLVYLLALALMVFLVLQVFPPIVHDIEHLLAAITVIALTFFLLLEGREMVERGTGRLPEPQRGRARRIAGRVAEVVKAYVSVNLLLAIAAGVLTWGFLQAGSFHLAVPLAVLVAFLDLIPLIGLTVGGFAVFAVLLIDGGPGDAIVWLALFLVYQQLQDRVIQPLLYKGGALKVNPAVAIVAVIVGAELAGVLGALLAIPTAASLGVVIDELVLSGSPGTAGAQPEPSE